MTASVECPKCGKAYRVKDQSIGARATCKNCHYNVHSNVTADNTPTYFITADLIDFENMGITVDGGAGTPGAPPAACSSSFGGAAAVVWSTSSAIWVVSHLAPTPRGHLPECSGSADGAEGMQRPTGGTVDRSPTGPV